MLKITPGQEEEFRFLQVWLAASAAMERVIEATECTLDASSWQGNVATDNALSRPIVSLNSRQDLKGPATTPHLLSGSAGQGRSTVLVHLYVADKLREFDRERLGRIPHAELRKPESKRVRGLGRLAAIAGRSMRRIGETLELWATPASEREHLRVALARTRMSD